MQNRISLLIIFILIFTVFTFPVAGQDQTELRMAWWGSQNRHDRTIAAIELYEDLNPDVDIVYEFAGWNDYWIQLSAQLGEGNLPDIMQQDYSRLEEWVDDSLLLPIDEYLENGTFDTTNIAESFLSSGEIDGQLYGINLGINSEAFVLDLDAFEAAGVELPPFDWTLEDFERTARDLHRALGIYGHAGGLFGDQLWKSLFMSCCDGWAYTDDGMALGYTEDQDQYLIDYFNMLLRLQADGVIPAADDEVSRRGSGIEADFFVTGEAAMGYFWSNQIIAIWEAAGEDRNFVMYPVPRVVDGQSRNYIKPSMFFSVTRNSQHPEEAMKFIDWFTNSIEANEVLFAERGVPISSVVREALAPELEVAQFEMFAYLSSLEDYNSPIRPPDPPAHTDIMVNIYQPKVSEPMQFGLISAEEGVAILREEIAAFFEDQ